MEPTVWERSFLGVPCVALRDNTERPDPQKLGQTDSQVRTLTNSWRNQN